MIKISGNDIWRGGKKIGWVEGHHVWDAQSGKKLGYFDDRHVYSEEGHKLAYLAENDLYDAASGHTRASLNEVAENIEGGVLPEIAKCAIYVLLGD